MTQSFNIFDLSAGQGRIGLCPLPGRNGALVQDVATICAWRPSQVVTLVAQAELDSHGASDLGARLAAKGVEWVHQPVVDFGIPPPDEHKVWDNLVQSLQCDLTQGGRVLVHCLGGCGRSGMLVLRTLIALEEPQDGALARLRSVRPCAIETDQQMLWATTA